MRGLGDWRWDLFGGEIERTGEATGAMGERLFGYVILASCILLLMI